MTVRSYPFSCLAVVIVFGVLATIAVPLFALTIVKDDRRVWIGFAGVRTLQVTV
jgi:hypothetical protein